MALETTLLSAACVLGSDPDAEGLDLAIDPDGTWAVTPLLGDDDADEEEDPFADDEDEGLDEDEFEDDEDFLEEDDDDVEEDADFDDDDDDF